MCQSPAYLSGNPTFRELLTRVRDVAFGAYAHQDLPFEQLVQEAQERDLSRHPLFQIAIALQNTPIDALELPGLQLDRFEFDSGTARLDLELQLWQNPASLQGQMTYSTDLFEQTTIARSETADSTQSFRVDHIKTRWVFCRSHTHNERRSRDERDEECRRMGPEDTNDGSATVTN